MVQIKFKLTELCGRLFIYPLLFHLIVQEFRVEEVLGYIHKWYSKYPPMT